MARPYDQYCALAAALDVVGDRWSLLVVRELLVGPRRYGELIDGIPGVPTDMLAARLRQLEADGLVEVIPVPGDRRAKAYRLTNEGRRLEESLLALTRFGLRRLVGTGSDRPFQSHWLGLAVRALFQPGAIDDEVRVRFVNGADHWQVRLDATSAVDDFEGEPDVIVRGKPSALLSCVYRPASAQALVAAGEVEISGKRADIRRLNRALRQPA